MKIINAKDLDMIPDSDISKKLADFLQSLKGNEEGITLNFDAGDYILDADNCPKETLYITNTIGDKEYHDDEIQHLHTIGIFINKIKNFTISGEGARFIVKGRMTNIVVEESENITINGIEIVADNPDLHEFTVTKAGLMSAEFELNSESQYICEDGKYYFTGKDFKTSFTDNMMKWPYFGKFFANDKHRIKRAFHPFKGYRSIKEISKNKFRVSFIVPKKFTLGDRYSIYDVRRLECGIFVENSKDITIKSVKQRFNISLAFVAQNTENITIDSVEFCPAENQVKQFVSYADFVQVCMCKGQVNVINSVFSGAGDDVLNVHGTHFRITEVEGNRIVCRFCHPQSHGYLAFNENDEIEFVDPGTLAAKGKTTVKSAKLLDEYNIELIVDSTKEAEKGLVIENITLCPDLYFADNVMDRIVTRGLLITTRGKVVVENNDFINTVMPSILFSDDAKSWFESGPCRDVTIRNNHFGECDEAYIRILPENGTNRNLVHGHFLVEGNTFEHNCGIEAKNSESLILRGNKYLETKSNFVRAKNVPEIVDD